MTRWSKLQVQVEKRFAASLRGRLRVRMVSYRKMHDQMGRAYFEFDGKEIGNFCEVSAFVHRGSNANPLCNDGIFAGWTKPITEITPGAVHERGEFSQHDFCISCFDWLQLPIEAALDTGNPLVLALALVDRRCGKRRLREMLERELPPIAQRLFEIRLAAEGMTPQTGLV